MNEVHGYINKKEKIMKFNGKNYIDDDEVVLIVDENHIKQEEIYKIKK